MFVEGLQGAVVIADDILVYGEGETTEDATKDHDEQLTKLFDKCKTTCRIKDKQGENKTSTKGNHIYWPCTITS